MFELHSRLVADTFEIGDLPLSRALLLNDSRYPWVILVPRLNDVTEIHQLKETDRQQLMAESCRVSEFMVEHFSIQKMNVAVLGNIVPQLHMHHIGRNENDPAWPGPVWGHSDAVPYSQAELEKMIQQLKGLI